LLEKEEWRYDKFPEFYNGSNVLDFYDADIEKKLDALEREEDKLLKMEALEDEITVKNNADAENSDDVDLDMLKGSLKAIRARKSILKQRHKLKAKMRVPGKNMLLSDMVAGMQDKGYDVTADMIRERSKSRRTIASLEEAQDKLAK